MNFTPEQISKLVASLANSDLKCPLETQRRILGIDPKMCRGTPRYIDTESGALFCCEPAAKRKLEIEEESKEKKAHVEEEYPAIEDFTAPNFVIGKGSEIKVGREDISKRQQAAEQVRSLLNLKVIKATGSSSKPRLFFENDTSITPAILRNGKLEIDYFKSDDKELGTDTYEQVKYLDKYIVGGKLIDVRSSYAGISLKFQKGDETKILSSQSFVVRTKLETCIKLLRGAVVTSVEATKSKSYRDNSNEYKQTSDSKNDLVVIKLQVEGEPRTYAIFPLKDNNAIYKWTASPESNYVTENLRGELEPFKYDLEIGTAEDYKTILSSKLVGAELVTMFSEPDGNYDVIFKLPNKNYIQFYAKTFMLPSTLNLDYCNLVNRTGRTETGVKVKDLTLYEPSD